jgi:hypothetical protein
MVSTHQPAEKSSVSRSALQFAANINVRKRYRKPADSIARMAVGWNIATIYISLARRFPAMNEIY